MVIHRITFHIQVEYHGMYDRLDILRRQHFIYFCQHYQKKKDAKVPIMLYILYAFLSLGTGRRVNFITSLLIIFAYAMCRNKIKPGEKPWIGKRYLGNMFMCSNTYGSNVFI